MRTSECSIDGCDNPAGARRGWCVKHYARWLKHGDVTTVLPHSGGDGTVHGGKGTRLYDTWKGMRQRVSNPNGAQWHRYGGRGITICPEWDDFAAFREWAQANGYADDLTIDRIDNDGNYEPANCRWIPRSENSARSIRPNAIPEGAMYRMHIEHQQGDSQRAVAERWGVSQRTVRNARRRFTP